MKIGVLTSGGLGFKVLSDMLKHNFAQFIATDSHSHDIINLATRLNIPLFKGNPRNGRLSAFVRDQDLDVILSINYLFLLEQDVIDIAKYAINLHGSLLPKYRGRTPHVWAIINNEKKTGVTAHLIDNDCDTGDIVLQREIEILPDMTGADILSVYENVYPDMICELFNLYQRASIKAKPQDHSKATYFGKRTPEDGQINWSWQKERIRNWVRAQAFPYPGAFSLLKGEKIIIDNIKYSDVGFREEDPNGLVIERNDSFFSVKTPNGVIDVTDIRNREVIEIIIKGDTL